TYLTGRSLAVESMKCQAGANWSCFVSWGKGGFCVVGGGWVQNPTAICRSNPAATLKVVERWVADVSAYTEAIGLHTHLVRGGLLMFLLTVPASCPPPAD